MYLKVVAKVPLHGLSPKLAFNYSRYAKCQKAMSLVTYVALSRGSLLQLVARVSG